MAEFCVDIVSRVRQAGDYDVHDCITYKCILFIDRPRAMNRPDWRDPAAYENLRSLDAPGFAWEYLRRNPEFQQEHERLKRSAGRGSPKPAEMEAFTRRWGCRFCQRPRTA